VQPGGINAEKVSSRGAQTGRRPGAALKSSAAMYSSPAPIAHANGICASAQKKARPVVSAENKLDLKYLGKRSRPAH
jgi:hypothetical protein